MSDGRYLTEDEIGILLEFKTPSASGPTCSWLLRRALECNRMRARVRELESALLSKDHLDVQSVLAFEAGKRDALLGMAEWLNATAENTVNGERRIAWEYAAEECRRRAEGVP